jgi:hypothetical protein
LSAGASAEADAPSLSGLNGLKRPYQNQKIQNLLGEGASPLSTVLLFLKFTNILNPKPS